MDFWLCRRSVPLTPALFKSQLCISRNYQFGPKQTENVEGNMLLLDEDKRFLDIIPKAPNLENVAQQSRIWMISDVEFESNDIIAL